MKKQDFIEMMKKAQAPLKGMVEMIPDDKLDWAPAKGFMTIAQVLKHLSNNWSLIKMMNTNEWPFQDPKEMEEEMKLNNIPGCTKAEALTEMEKDLNDAIRYLEAEISEEDFSTKDVSAPWGFQGKLWQGAMMGRDHTLNHKMQLHLYLKLLGQPVHTGTLYGM